MKVLVVTRNAWDDTNAIGNTISNFFSGIEDVTFANLYFREAAPNNALCRLYYRTSEPEVLKKWFSPQKIGRRFTADETKKSARGERKEKNEKKLVRFIQKHGVKLAYKLSDRIWYSEKWINTNFKEFIASYAPDVLFTFVKSAPQYALTVKYVHEQCRIPVFTWIADDEYTGLLKKNSQREIQNLRYILGASAVVKGCSEEICGYYNSVFGCNATPLYKSCDLSLPVKETVNDPVKVVYAGNLLYGRLEIIRKIADAIEGCAAKGRKLSFEVYSNTALSPDEVQRYFGGTPCTQYMGRKDHQTIKDRLSKADIVLHVESFDEEQILKTKYSFSTKIVDYLQSGSVLLAVGPSQIASMRYIRRIPGAYVIDGLDDLQEKISAVCGDSSGYIGRAREMREFARQHHDASVLAGEMTETLHGILGGR